MLRKSPAAVASSLGHVRYASTFKKYTLQPKGIWATVNKWLAVDPSRSSGVPLNPQFRNPPPAALDPTTYDDPVTAPAGDIAENPYWKRDVRRRYAKPSTITQGDVVALLTVGNKTAPKQELIGEAGTKELVAVKQEGEKGLAPFFQKEKNLAAGVLGENGLPPMPVAFGRKKAVAYKILPEQSYGTVEAYPCRTFE